MRLAVALALLTACTVEHQVLDDPSGVVTSCDEAWTVGQTGAPCAFEAPCDQSDPFDPMCCTDYAYCSSEGLVMDIVCDPSCGCDLDEQCTFGAAICEDRRCVDCPPTDLCGACPDGWVPLTRNGCPTCQCAPPSECDFPGDSCDPGGTTGEICYGGQTCAEGCDGTQPGCCSNACSAAGCPDRAPVGCFMECPSASPCTLCAAGTCECDGVAWQCTAVCVEDLAVTFTCTYP